MTGATFDGPRKVVGRANQADRPPCGRDPRRNPRCQVGPGRVRFVLVKRFECCRQGLVLLLKPGISGHPQV